MRALLFLCSGNYYRSRFAEAVFNHHAERTRLSWRATSAGLTPRSFAGNPGPISRHVVAALAERGIELDLPHRAPVAVTADMLREASRVVAVKAAEHRPMIAARFPDHAHQVEYWHIDDVDVAPPGEVLPMLEARVVALVRELAASGAP